MRGFLLNSLMVVILASLGGCRCSPANPSPVTLRIVNGGSDAIYVDTTRGTLGLTVQRDVGGTLYPFDDLACACRYCDQVCDVSCSCPAVGPDLIQRIGPAESVERVWDGVIQVSGLTSCGDGTCLQQVNAPLNEPFTLELCFSSQKPTGADFMDGGVALGQLPQVSLTCTTQKFEPRDGVVEIGPERGAPAPPTRSAPAPTSSAWKAPAPAAARPTTSRTGTSSSPHPRTWVSSRRSLAPRAPASPAAAP